MNLKNLISPDSVVCNAGVASKKRALELLADLLAKQSGTDKSLEIFHLLTEREKLGSTSLGHGIALPHTRTNLCNQTFKDRKSTRLNSSHTDISRMPSSA